jgi:murein DD-endopeptidase MepM/ murein hydrolase activator NlpD
VIKSSKAQPQGLSRRGLIAGAGALSAGAILAQLGIAMPAFASTISDPWFQKIRSWNWDWHGHRTRGYSGGQDYAFAFGDAIYAPAAGTLGTGSGGTVRFTLDSPVSRVLPAEEGESGATLAAVEFMHLSAYGSSGHYAMGGGPIAYVGNTNTTSAHLHVHGISSTGHRVDWRKFVGIPSSTQLGAAQMLMIYQIGTPWKFALFGPNFWYEWTAPDGSDSTAAAFLKQITGGPTYGGTSVDATQWAAIKAATGN